MYICVRDVEGMGKKNRVSVTKAYLQRCFALHCGYISPTLPYTKMYVSYIKLHFMEKGEVITLLYHQLFELAQQPEMDFLGLASGWGRTGSDDYNRKKIQFSRSMRKLAMSGPVKYWNGSYYVFTGKIYEPVDSDTVTMAITMLLESINIADMIGKNGVAKAYYLDPVKFFSPLRPRFDLQAFENGVVDLSVPDHPLLLPFSKDYPVVHYNPYKFDAKAKCPKWMHFLYEVLPDKKQRTILQMFLGLGLIQRGEAFDVTNSRYNNGKVELCLLLVGQGANGKSVIFEVAMALFGRDRVSKMDYANLTADGDEGMRGRYPIRNAIFNWSSDTDAKKFGKKNTGMFKRIVSGEPVPMRKLGSDVMESGQIPYLIFNLNELPKPDDNSLGFVRRLQYISFDVVIPKDRQNPELANILIRNELPGIFNWVLRGTNEIRARKFRFPVSTGSRYQVLKTLLGSAPILSWVKAFGLRNDKLASKEISAWVTTNTLYQSFVQFCHDNDVEDEAIVKISSFSRTLWDKCCFHKKRSAKGVVFEVYGSDEEALMRHVVLQPDVDEIEDVDDTKRRKSYIKEDD